MLPTVPGGGDPSPRPVTHLTGCRPSLPAAARPPPAARRWSCSRRIAAAGRGAGQTGSMATSPFAPSGAQIPLTHGDHHVVIVEVGGAIRSYRLRDWDVLDGY